VGNLAVEEGDAVGAAEGDDATMGEICEHGADLGAPGRKGKEGKKAVLF
jgi:hypothetical protein